MTITVGLLPERTLSRSPLRFPTSTIQNGLHREILVQKRGIRGIFNLQNGQGKGEHPESVPCSGLQLQLEPWGKGQQALTCLCDLEVKLDL